MCSRGIGSLNCVIMHTCTQNTQFITREKMFLQNFISSRDGPEESTETMYETKEGYPTSAKNA